MRLALAFGEQLGQVAEVVIGRAGALGRDHQCAQWGLRRAGAAEYLALPGPNDALEYLAALAGLGVGDLEIGYREPALGIEAGIGVTHLHAGVVDGTQAAPFEELAQLEDLVDRLQARPVAAGRYHTRILVLDLAATLRQLLDHHPQGLQDIQRFKAGDYDRLGVGLGDEAERRLADHHADVTGREEGVQLHVGRVQDGLDGRHRGDVIAEQREVVDAFAFGLQHRHGGTRHRGLEAEAEEDHLAIGVLARQTEGVQR